MDSIDLAVQMASRKIDGNITTLKMCTDMLKILLFSLRTVRVDGRHFWYFKVCCAMASVSELLILQA